MNLLPKGFSRKIKEKQIFTKIKIKQTKHLNLKQLKEQKTIVSANKIIYMNSFTIK